MKKICPVLLAILLPWLSLHAQYVGIGTNSPVSLLHVKDSSVLFTGADNFTNYNPPQPPPVQGPGTRMLWYPVKGAFRAGWVENNRWDKDSIGIFSMALGHSALASNTGSFATGVRTAARGVSSVAMGWNSIAEGNNAFTVGYFNRATLDNSIALGTENLASGYFATSIGIHTVSSGNSAVAMGDSAIASGDQSVAIGAYVYAKARASFAAGWFNDNTDNPNPMFSATTDRIFQVGNGDGFLGTRSNALTVLRNANTGIAITNPRFPLSFAATSGDKISLYDDGNPGQVHFGFGIGSNQLLQIHGATTNDDIAFGYGKSSAFTEAMRIKGNGRVGIGTTNPQARLHVADSAVVFTANAILPVSPSAPPVSGAGVRMLWYPDRAAFRAGRVSGTEWDQFSIGNGSVAMGLEVTASGIAAVALGQNNTVAGNNSIALGYYANASADRSLAAGYVAAASGFATTAIGFGANASGNYSTSIGANTYSIGGGSIAMGDNAIARGLDAVSIGAYTKARSDYSFVAGTYNDTTALNRIFEIGNGTADNARSNALTIYTNGNTLFYAPASLPGTPGLPPASGAGNRMMWYAERAAFRAGNVTGTNWDKDQTGNYSFAGGSNTQASGNISTAFGNFTFATGDISFTAGNSVFAKAKTAAAFGTYNDITDSPNGTAEASGDRIFQVGNGTSNLARTNALTILRNGNIGVGGVTNPTRTLSFPAVLGEKILLYPGGTGEVGIGVYGNELRLHCDNPGSSVSFGTQDNAGVFTQAGRFQISAPYALFVNGSIWANGTTYASDARFKQNITPLLSPLERLMRLRGVEYEMNASAFPANHFMPGRQMGLLAQEVQQVVPEAVQQQDGYMGVDYARLVPLLIESIKELKMEVETLKKKLIVDR